MPAEPSGTGPILDREPVAVFIGALAATVDAGIVAGNALGWLDLTGGQSAAVVAFVSAVSALVIPPLRQLVTCRATARRAGIGTP